MNILKTISDWFAWTIVYKSLAQLAGLNSQTNSFIMPVIDCLFPIVEPAHELPELTDEEEAALAAWEDRQIDDNVAKFGRS